MFLSKILWACPRDYSPDLRWEEATMQHRLAQEGSQCHPTGCTSRTPGAMLKWLHMWHINTGCVQTIYYPLNNPKLPLGTGIITTAVWNLSDYHCSVIRLEYHFQSKTSKTGVLLIFFHAKYQPPNLWRATAVPEVPPAVQIPGCHGRVQPTPHFQAISHVHITSEPPRAIPLPACCSSISVQGTKSIRCLLSNPISPADTKRIIKG